jgi:endonuclease/exonuclease/phosphatase family metal-dependent hydrolase
MQTNPRVDMTDASEPNHPTLPDYQIPPHLRGGNTKSHMKLLTYNIHGLPWSSIDVPAIISWIFNESDAEIICLQEVFSHDHRALLWHSAIERGWDILFPNDLIYSGVITGLENGSGLVTLLHPKFKITSKPKFESYTSVNGADRIVKKGFFIVSVTDGTHTFQVINTHMQSDITEICCIRLNFNTSRHAQERQLFLAANNCELPLIIGDANTCIFNCFQRVDMDTHVTFPETEEHLDHLLCVPRDIEKIEHIDTVYHDAIMLSDHIPVVYTVRLLLPSLN